MSRETISRYNGSRVMRQSSKRNENISQSVSKSVNQSVQCWRRKGVWEVIASVLVRHPDADNSGYLPLRENHPRIRWFDPSSEQLLQPFLYVHISIICIHVCSSREKLQSTSPMVLRVLAHRLAGCGIVTLPLDDCATAQPSDHIGLHLVAACRLGNFTTDPVDDFPR